MTRLGVERYHLVDLPRHFSPQLTRRWIAGVLFAIGGFLILTLLNSYSQQGVQMIDVA